MNKNILKVHLEILDENRQETLKDLTPFLSDFVLGGGTGLALQLTHRSSFDFDFFSFSEIPSKLLEKLSRGLKIENVAVDNKDE